MRWTLIVPHLMDGDLTHDWKLDFSSECRRKGWKSKHKIRSLSKLEDRKGRAEEMNIFRLKLRKIVTEMPRQEPKHSSCGLVATRQIRTWSDTGRVPHSKLRLKYRPTNKASASSDSE